MRNCLMDSWEIWAIKWVQFLLCSKDLQVAIYFGMVKLKLSVYILVMGMLCCNIVRTCFLMWNNSKSFHPAGSCIMGKIFGSIKSIVVFKKAYTSKLLLVPLNFDRLSFPLSILFIPCIVFFFDRAIPCIVPKGVETRGANYGVTNHSHFLCQSTRLWVLFLVA